MERRSRFAVHRPTTPVYCRFPGRAQHGRADNIPIIPCPIRAKVGVKQVRARRPDRLQPNASGGLDLTLSPGSHLLICNIPGHFASGMPFRSPRCHKYNFFENASSTGRVAPSSSQAVRAAAVARNDGWPSNPAGRDDGRVHPGENRRCRNQPCVPTLLGDAPYSRNKHIHRRRVGWGRSCYETSTKAPMTWGPDRRDQGPTS